ncbi:MAG: ABC transporter permease [Alkaliphilus sp.]|nr:MAG: ABC transporter permease [Alkaliphilus sp.]
MHRKPTIKSTFKAFLYLLPALTIISTFSFYPVVRSLLMSFHTDYNFFTGEVYSYGIDNFIYIFNDPDFWLAMRNTFLFVVGVVPAAIVISLGISVLLNSKIKFRGLFRTIYFIPFVTSVVAISIVWSWIYHSEYGILNYFLGWFGIDPIAWLIDPAWSMPAIIIMSIWRSLGYNIIIFLAGLQNIDKKYYLAAQIDGASKWQQFRNITLPLLSPSIFFISIVSLIGGFKVFDEVFALFDGRPGPVSSALTIVYYIYEKFYMEWEFGIASAAAYALFVITLAFTLIQMYIGKKKVHY